MTIARTAMFQADSITSILLNILKQRVVKRTLMLIGAIYLLSI